MVAGEIVPRAGYKCGESSDEVSRGEEQVRGAIAEDVFETQGDLAIGVQ